MHINTKQILGLILCAVLSIPAYLLGLQFPLVGAPVFAIIIGMALGGFLKARDAYEEGIQFTSKKVLQAAVVLLGFGLSLQKVVEVGATSLPVIVSTVGASLLCAYLVSKVLKTDRDISVLVGVGSSICGGSAIAATAPVIKANDKDVATAISVIFFFNILAAIIFPSLGQLLGLSHEGFSLFAGTAVNDTSSVTAAAAAWDARTGANTLDAATIVKLTRTLAIIPIAICLSIYQAKREGCEAALSSGEVPGDASVEPSVEPSAKSTGVPDMPSNTARFAEKPAKLKLKNLLPSFIVFFLLAILISTLVPLPDVVVHSCKTLSKYFICMAMLAIGLNTNILALIKSAGKALILGLACWVVIIGVSLAMQYALGLL